MGKGVSTDLRVRVYGAIERGETRRAATRRFGVCASRVVRGPSRHRLGHFRLQKLTVVVKIPPG